MYFTKLKNAVASLQNTETIKISLHSLVAIGINNINNEKRHYLDEFVMLLELSTKRLQLAFGNDSLGVISLQLVLLPSQLYRDAMSNENCR